MSSRVNALARRPSRPQTASAAAQRAKNAAGVSENPRPACSQTPGTARTARPAMAAIGAGAARRPSAARGNSVRHEAAAERNCRPRNGSGANGRISHPSAIHRGNPGGCGKCDGRSNASRPRANNVSSHSHGPDGKSAKRLSARPARATAVSAASRPGRRAPHRRQVQTRGVYDTPRWARVGGTLVMGGGVCSTVAGANLPRQASAPAPERGADGWDVAQHDRVRAGGRGAFGAPARRGAAHFGQLALPGGGAAHPPAARHRGAGSGAAPSAGGRRGPRARAGHRGPRPTGARHDRPGAPLGGRRVAARGPGAAARRDRAGAARAARPAGASRVRRGRRGVGADGRRAAGAPRAGRAGARRPGGGAGARGGGAAAAGRRRDRAARPRSAAGSPRSTTRCGPA